MGRKQIEFIADSVPIQLFRSNYSKANVKKDKIFMKFVQGKTLRE